jgi:sulfur oxidation c-type cytochrome SoxX
MRPAFSPGKNKKEIYQEEYEASKKGGESFYPETLVRDAIVAFVVVAVVITLALLFPATTEPPADPTSTTYNPRPEWYFLFFFQFLKLFPGWLEPVAAVVIPGIALLILLLVPFLDRKYERRWSQRKYVITLGGLVLSVLIALEVMGAMSAPAVPAGEESKLVQEGREVYQEINCSYCHSINEVGGNIGPDLSTVGGELDRDSLIIYLQNPHAMIPATLHPKLLFTDEELDALVEYLLTLGASVSYTTEAATLYEEKCSSCHMVNGKGGTLGPDLSGIGERRSLGFLEAFTANPDSVLPGATMPAYKDSLTPEQIKDIAAYLYSLKDETP